MRALAVIGAALVVAIPEVLRLIEGERQRRHEAEEREKDRQNALEVARVGAAGVTRGGQV